jgi:MFS family permease
MLMKSLQSLRITLRAGARTQPKTPPSKLKVKTRLILGVAVFAYFVSVLERSSMGVASLAAVERFQVGAATLSSLAVAQLAVYASMQIPTGMLLDKFGARKLIIFGSFMTGIGNLVVALAPVFGLAILGRMVVGFGDAFVFVSMIRLINGWAPGPQATKYTQLFANIGQLGQIASAVPFAYLLNSKGWEPAFTIAASLAFIAATLGFLFLRNEPGALEQSEKIGLGLWPQFKENLRDPHTRKAFWVHFTMQSSGSMFILLWGYPFMIQGEGLSRPVASGLLASFVFIGFFVGPVLSSLCIKWPERRHLIVATLYSAIAIAWLLIFLTPGTNPFWQIILLVLSIGIGGPASMIAFDYSRVAIPKHRLGSSNGIINSGGFVATFISMALVGIALDTVHTLHLVGNQALYSLAAFKLAFPLELAVITFGLIRFYRARAEARQSTKLESALVQE